MLSKRIILMLLLINLSLFSKEINMRNETNKLTLIYFEMSHCPYCRKMHKESFDDEKIKDFIENNFVYKNINIEKNDIVIYQNETYDTGDFAKTIDVFFFPSVLFMDKNNKIVEHVKGFRNYDKFTYILKYMASVPGC